MFWRRDPEYWKLMADDFNETWNDANMLKNLNFEDFISGGESVADYATNIFLYWELWDDYLQTDSFLKYGWLDVNASVMHETLYRMEQSYFTILLVSIFLLYMGFFYFCIIYLIAVISWPCYDDESDADLSQHYVTAPGLDVYINLRSNWRSYAKKLKYLNEFKDFSVIPVEWRVYYAFLQTPYDWFSLDDLLQLQAWKALNSKCLLRSKVSTKNLKLLKIFYNKYIAYYNEGVYRAFMPVCKKKSKSLKSMKEQSVIFAHLYALELSSFENKYFLVDWGQITLRHKVLDYELYLLDLNVRHWYYFKTKTPIKDKKVFYLL